MRRGSLGVLFTANVVLAATLLFSEPARATEEVCGPCWEGFWSGVEPWHANGDFGENGSLRHPGTDVDHGTAFGGCFNWNHWHVCCTPE